MRKLLSIVFFTLSFVIYSFGFQKSNADSILQKIESSPIDIKIELWEEWFDNPSRDNIVDLYESNHIAFVDAKEKLGRDSAVIWHFKKSSQLIKQLRTFGHQKLATKILDKNKTTADSLSTVYGSVHWTLPRWYFDIANFYYMEMDKDKAEEMFLKSLEVNQEVNDKELSFRVHNILGLMHSWYQEFDKAELDFVRADSVAQFVNLSSKDKVNLIYNKGYLAKMQNNLELVDRYFKVVVDSIHLYPNNVAHRRMIDYASNLCNLGRINDCVNYFDKLKPKILAVGDDYTLVTFGEDYTDALILAGRSKEAKEWAEKTRSAFYRVEATRRNAAVLEWRSKFETSEKEAQIQLLEQETQLSRTRLIIISLIGLVGIGILSFFIYRNKNRQKELALKLERDRQIAENRDRLFSSITHDIRTPLALMMAPLERAEKHVINHSAKADINLARRNGKRLMELFNQILDWNKAEAKALQLNPQIGQLDFTFTALCQRYEQQAHEKAVIFSQNVKMPKGQFLLDYDKLDKILSNLVGNAIKFCDTGQTVTLNADFEKKDGLYSLVMEVKDQGPGIAAEEQKELFQRYVQGTQGKLKGGTGIGLALVKELVEMLNGSIQLKSELGKGASFKVTLPIQMVEEESVAPLQNEDTLITTDNPTEEEKTLILVVEDEPELLEFLRSALSDEYEVEVANSTTTGLNVAITRIPEIIISDWTLPDNTGGWLCQQISKNELTAHIPVMILTAHNSDINQKEAFESGAVAWMNKPFQLDTLKRQLHTILMQQRRVQNIWSKKEKANNVSDEQEQQVETIDPFMEKVVDVIESNYQVEGFSVEKMAGMLLLSRVQLFRKVKSITGNTPRKMIIEYRLNRAKQLLQNSGKSVSEISFEVGFSDPSYFGKAYKQYFNHSPSQDLGSS